MEPTDWRTQLHADDRECAVNMLVNTLKNRHPTTVLSNILKVVTTFEEVVYMAAKSKKEYATRISLKVEELKSSSSNPGFSGLKTSNPGGNQGQSISVQTKDHSQAYERYSMSVPNSATSCGVSSNLPSERPTVSVSAEVPLKIGDSGNSNSESIFSNSPKLIGNLSGHGDTFNASSNNLRQGQGRLHSPLIDTQKNHDQINPHVGIQVKQENISPSSTTQQEQLQQQQYHQQKQIPPSQQQISHLHVVQTPAVRPSQTLVASLQQDQISSFKSTPPSVIKNHLHTASTKLNQSQESPDTHQNVSSRHVLNLTATNIQQNQLNRKPSVVPDLQQQQPRFPCQQVGDRNSISVLQQNLQLRGTQCANSSMRLCEVKAPIETPQTSCVLLTNQGQRSQPLFLERQMNSQWQSEKMQKLPNPSEQGQQQAYQTSGTLPSTDNWLEAVYQKVQRLKGKFLKPLSHMLQNVTSTLQQFHSVSQQTEETDYIKKLKSLKHRLTYCILYLTAPESKFTPSVGQKLDDIEKYIVWCIDILQKTKRVPSLQHVQLSSDAHSARPLDQHHSQAPRVQTVQDENKQELQSVNFQCSATTPINLVNDLKENPTEQYAGKLNSLNVVQKVASGLSKVPTVSPQQPLPSHHPAPEPQSNINALESSCSTLQEIHMRQPKEEWDVQIQKPKQDLQMYKMHQQLVQQNQEPVNLQSGASFPTALPQIPGSSCQQVPQCSSEIDKKMLPTSLRQVRTTVCPTDTPSNTISSSVPLVSTSVPGVSDKLISDTSSLSNAENIGDKQVNSAGEAPSPFVISTPGMSTSPLLEESTGDIDCKTSTLISDQLQAFQQPIERFTKVVNLMSSKALSASVLDIDSVVHATDRIAGSEAVRGSRGLVGDDLADVNLQKRYLTRQEKTSGIRKTKHRRITVPIGVVASATGNTSDRLPNLIDMEELDLDSTAMPYIKQPRIEVNQTLVEEITAINHQLIDTVLDISDEDARPKVASAPIKDGEGIIVRCSFIGVTVNANLKSEQYSAQMPQIHPLRLLVPANYPLCSPIFLDKLQVDVSDELEDLSAKAKAKLSYSLRSWTKPLSLGEIARTWDACVQAFITECAMQNGGGSFSSKYGDWEDCGLIAA